jgi:hypothetical protein
MRDILVRLRSVAGQLTLATLIQEREAAACEIERLRGERASHVPAVASRPSHQFKATNESCTDRSAEVPALQTIRTSDKGSSHRLACCAQFTRAGK